MKHVSDVPQMVEEVRQLGAAIWQRGRGSLGGNVQQPQPWSFITAVITTTNNFKSVAFKIGNANFNLKA